MGTVTVCTSEDPVYRYTIQSLYSSIFLVMPKLSCLTLSLSLCMFPYHSKTASIHYTQLDIMDEDVNPVSAPANLTLVSPLGGLGTLGLLGLGEEVTTQCPITQPCRSQNDEKIHCCPLLGGLGGLPVCPRKCQDPVILGQTKHNLLDISSEYDFLNETTMHENTTLQSQEEREQVQLNKEMDT